VHAIVGDRAYRGLLKLAERKRVTLDIKAPPKGTPGFTPLWPLHKVEHTIAQLGRWRRLSRCYEGIEASARAWLEVASVGLTPHPSPAQFIPVVQTVTVAQGHDPTAPLRGATGWRVPDRGSEFSTARVRDRCPQSFRRAVHRTSFDGVRPAAFDQGSKGNSTAVCPAAPK
jgi:transposase